MSRFSDMLERFTIKLPAMDTDKASLFLIANNDKFPEEYIVHLKERIDKCDETKLNMLYMLQFKDPTITLVLSLFVGSLGIDRFYLGDTGLGVIKLLTCGGLGIWTIVDWFLIMGIAREKNFNKAMSVL